MWGAAFDWCGAEWGFENDQGPVSLMKRSAQAVAAGQKVQRSPAVFCCWSGGSDEKSTVREACQKRHVVLNNTGTHNPIITHTLSQPDYCILQKLARLKLFHILETA